MFLRKTKYNIRNYLSFALGEMKSNSIFKRIDEQKEILYNAKTVLNEINQLGYLISEDKNSKERIKYFNKDGFLFTINSNNEINGKSFSLEKPFFIFDPAGIRTDMIPDKGLNTFGPYDSTFFNPKTPKILAIFNKDNRGFFTQFMNSLLKGMPSSKYFKKGLIKKYELHDVDIILTEVNSYDIQNYEKTIKSLDEKPDLVMVEIPESARHIDIVDSLYYQLKALFMGREIPVQIINTLKIKSYNEYILNALALQIYAKLGGTPWVLPASTTLDREIIIGIGNSIIRKSSFRGAPQNRVVGITTFFSGDGQYLMANRAKDVLFEEYFEELLNNLRDSLRSLEKKQGWNNGDTIRLIFHIFKPIKNIEYEAVKQIINEFTKYRIQFSFVTISKKHPFLIFSPDQKGIKNYHRNEGLKGQYLPMRGTNIILYTSTCLLQMIGAKEIKSVKHGMGNPLLVRIRLPEGSFEKSQLEELLFTDLHYIVQQIYNFTYLSWRSFLPVEHPVTMLYSNLISSLLGKLRKIKNWQPNAVNYDLKFKKWFL